MVSYIAATAVLWAVSGLLAVVVALFLAAGSVSPRRAVRLAGESIITLTRGLPTAFLVIAAGIMATRFPDPGWLPNPFPGTGTGSVLVAWAVVIALAFGSTGHLAVIFRNGYYALGRYLVEQVEVLGLPRLPRLGLIVHEAARTALAPTAARLVHHLHNTAFAALFPVADLFGWVQEGANSTFEVTYYVLIGAAAYVAMSAAIWGAARGLEFRITAGSASVARRRPSTGEL